MAITLRNLQTKANLNLSQILKIAKTILRQEGVSDANLSIVFATRQRITVLNKKYLHRNRATDVLAFDMGRPASGADKSFRKKTALEGEIVISTDAAFKNTKIFATTPAHELTLYIIHGILHLLGWDDHHLRGIKKMRQREQEILDFLGTKAEKVLR